MNDKLTVPIERLFQRCDPASLGFESTADLTPLSTPLGQERAVSAVDFGVNMRCEGYNMFVLGPPAVGKHFFVKQLLQEYALKREPPPDWIYLYNFSKPNKPLAVRLDNGLGDEFCKDMRELVESLMTSIPSAFESEVYEEHLKEIEENLRQRQEAGFGELQKEANQHSLELVRTPRGFVFAPTENGQILQPEEFDKLDDSSRRKIEVASAALEEKLQNLLQQIPKWRQNTRAQIKQLNSEVTLLAVGYQIDALKVKYSNTERLDEYLSAVQQDVIENVDFFRQQEDSSEQAINQLIEHGFLRRYSVNVIIGHSTEPQAPVIYERNPTHDNLVGKIENMAQMGTLVTDFMLIKPGALHRANGGFLIIDVRKLLVHPYAWEALKRALSSHEICIESLGEMLGMIHTVSLDPEQIPLDLKVVLLGDRLLYYLLCEYDPDFNNLFKVAADFEESLPRDEDTNQAYAQLIATLVQQNKLKPFHNSAVARMIEQASRWMEDTQKLSLHMGQISDLCREADYWAEQEKNGNVTAAHVDKAIAQQIFRANRYETHMHEHIMRDITLISTVGEVVGQVNCLSVIDMGHYIFGRPSRVTATARCGENKVIDIEREVELGGDLHTKGVMIMSSFIAARYARNKPLSLSASIVFEQSYGEVEGDSASLGELCALLSAIAEVPLKQGLAITGSMNQLGEVQAIGGVNEKIEGFYEVCVSRGFNDEQGVIIPRCNLDHLMLKPEVVDAVKEGKFHIFAVERVDEAISLLTGLAAGERDKDGNYPDESLNQTIENALLEMAKQAHHHEEHDEEESEEEEKPGKAGKAPKKE